ncbi:MAG: hypothetical protein HZA03_09015 [Nitrospinae bacterium]|nr:hypothetical protein [Nitrospinota bacterium]
MMKSLLIVSLIAALLGSSNDAVAKRFRDSYTTPGFLKAWEWAGQSGDLEHGGATAAEMKALVGKMLELRELLKASPVAGRPVGYNTILTGHFEPFHLPERHDLKARDFPLRALIWFGAFPQEFDDNGKLLPTIGETTLMAFKVNMLPMWVENPTEWSDQLTDVSLHPRHFKDLAGLPHFGDIVVLKRNSRPLWLPVSFEESFKLILAQRKQKVAEFEKKAAELRKDYADYITPAHRAERQENYKLASRSQKDPAAFLAQMDQLDRTSEEVMCKQAEGAAPDRDWHWWADAIAKVKEAERDFASLSAEQKAAPACYMDQSRSPNPDTRLPVSFVPIDTPQCRPVIRPNWSYFDPALPRTAIQLLTVWVRDCPAAKPSKDGNPAGCAANMALLQSLDWEAVKAIMDR